MDNFEVDYMSEKGPETTEYAPGATIGGVPEYPSEWFANNPGSKPPLMVPPLYPDRAKWAKTLGVYTDAALHPTVVVRFLVEFKTTTISEKLTSDWESYKIVIGVKGDTVTPLSLVDQMDDEAIVTVAEGPAIENSEKIRLFVILIAGYRYGIASEIQLGDYKSAVMARINQLIVDTPFYIRPFDPGELTLAKTWYNNSEYRVIVAALDMFWHKFPTSKYAKLRICTHGSRYRDCAFISELKHLTEISGRKLREILQYVFNLRINDVMKRITRPGEEGTKEDSYFPYMREMRLSRKSPYSSSQNMHLHTWIGMFGALLGSHRSFNARIVSEASLVLNLNLAIFAANAFSQYTKGGRGFGDADAFDEMIAFKAIEEDSMLRGRFAADPSSPQGVYNHMTVSKGVVPDHIIAFFKKTIDSMGPPRDNNIGNDLYGWAMSQYMSYGGFRWRDPDEAFAELGSLCETSEVGRIFDVDISYTQHLHDAHNDLPFLPESGIPPGSKIKKLMTTFLRKEHYLMHYQNLKQAIAHGLKVEKV